MRSVALGEAWVDAGGACILISAGLPPALEARVAEGRGFLVRRIDAEAWSRADSQAVAALVQQFSARAVVADSYLYDAAYLSALKDTGVCVTAIDDLARLPTYPCDVLVNPNLAGEEALYVGKAEHARRLLGPRYVMLRREFSRHRSSVRSIATIARKLLVTFGGVDPKNGGGLALEALAMLPNLEIDFVIGAANIRADELAAKAAALPNVRVVRDARDMAARIMECEMLLSAGGTTVWEAAALGAPMMLAAAAPEEANAALRLAKGGLALFLGEIEALTPKAVADAVSDFAGDMAARARSSVLGRELVDGFGAERVVETIAALI
jgi:spore coat polysaccharide biosynthesis predicted glycosyltransferase SpsG